MGLENISAGPRPHYPVLDQGFSGIPPADPIAQVSPGGSSPTTSISQTGVNRIDSLMYGVKWGGGAGSGVALDYSFPGYGAAWASYYGNDEPSRSFSPLTSSQQGAANKALALWSEVANVDFTQIAETAANVGDIRFANSDAPPAAWAYYPGAYPEAGDVWFGRNYDFNSGADGTYSFYAFVHELGHALGLKHPHEGSPRLSGADDWVGNTVMSYNIATSFLPSTAMLYDIAAIQHIYGANMSTRAGASVYKWAPGEQIFETIWDGGGIDTIDWSNQSSAARINLAAGAWSELGPPNGFGARTLAIAETVTIENANGGSGNDELNGNADRSDGNDTLYGDDGNDRIFGSYGDDLMYGGAGVDELGGQAGNDTMYGGAGNDKLGGGAGNDKLGGGTGNDKLYGEADADLLTGREGLDQLSGGTGNDIFDYDAVTDSRPGAANRDVILDFVGVGKAVGDRIDLVTIDANSSKGGNQAFVFKGAGAITGAGQVHVVKAGADTLIQANTGGSLAPELEILVKDGAALHSQWVAGDFLL